MLFFLGQVFPYIGVAVFVIGMSWRIGVWLKTPVPFPQTLFPAPADNVGRLITVGKEALLFGGLLRGDAGLWLWAWWLHVFLAMIIGGHVVGIYTLTQEFVPLGLSPVASSQMSALLGTMAGLGFFVCLTMLFYRRTAIPEVKRLSDPADYFELLLLLAIVVSGLHMRMTTLKVNLPAIRDYLGSLIFLHPMAIPQEWIFISHFTLVNILLLYFPFSKLAHMAGMLVNRALLVAAAPVYPSKNLSVTPVRLYKGGAN